MSASRATFPPVLSRSDGPQLVSMHSDTCAESVKAVEELRPAWESLPAASPMQSFIWAQACAQAFPNAGLRIVSAGEPRPRAIAAFIASPDSAALIPLGAELYEPTEFAYADDGAAEELSELIVRLKEPVLIRDMPADSIIVESLRRFGGRRLVTSPSGGRPWLELDDSWLEPESHLNSGRRSDLRRALRNAEKQGPVRCEITTPTQETLAPLLHDAFRVEAAGWKGDQGSALATDPQVGAFYTKLAQAACQRGILRIGMLRIGDHPAAMQLAIERDGCLWLFKMGFDESFARFSPGTLLMVESLRSARQRGCNRYELMGKSEAWNRIWAPRLHESVSLNLCAPTLRGWVNVVAEHAKGAIKTQLRGGMESSS
jgi:CelD/BcsL family acetyltransferase involved in cellulose biosynthesis